MEKLTKRQVKVLKEMWKFRFSQFGKAQEWRGKYYWGDYETGSRPIGTVTLDQLVRIGLVEHVRLIGGHYRLAKDGQYICSEYFDKDDNFIGISN